MRGMLLRIKGYRFKLTAFLFWVSLWQVLSVWVDNSIFLVSPFQVVKSLVRLLVTQSFWFTVLSSTVKISVGFFLALLVGILLAIVTYRFQTVKEITLLGMQFIKSIPVASFVILALLWIRAKNLSVLISFLMVLPLVYMNVLKGIETCDVKLLEMAMVFRMKPLKKLRYIYMPSVLPYLITASSVGLGFCWKSGIAAEVISLADFSIGSKLYEAKLYLITDDLFAWTFVIVAISFIFEKLVMSLILRVSNLVMKVKPEVMHGRSH